MPRNKPHNSPLIFLVFFLFSIPCDGDDSLVRTEVTQQRTRLNLDVGYTNLNVRGVDLSSLTMAGGITYGITDTVAAGLLIRHGAALSGLSSVFFGLDLRARIAIFGRAILSSSVMTVGDKKTYTSRDRDTGGLYWDIYFHQYFLKLSTATVAFPGLGTGIEYELNLWEMTNLGIGGRIDQATNGSISFYPIQFFVGLKFWL